MGILNADPCQEKDLILSFLNDAYQIAVQEAGVGWRPLSAVVAAGSLTGPVAALDIVTDLGTPGVLMFRTLQVTGAQGPCDLILTDEAHLIRMATINSTGGTPQYYALPDDQTMLIFPTPTAETTFTGSFIPEPKILVETVVTPADEEDTPTRLRVRYQFDLLANAAIAMVMEYDQRQEEANYYRGLADNALQSLKGFLNEFGAGPMGPRIRNLYERKYRRKLPDDGST